MVNPLTPNDHYRGRSTSLNSKRYILYIYSTNIRTEYFKHDIYSPCLSLLNVVCFTFLTYLVPVLFTFYIQDLLKLKKNNSGAKMLNVVYTLRFSSLENAVCFIILTYMVSVLFTFYIQGVLKFKKKNIIPASKY